MKDERIRKRNRKTGNNEKKRLHETKRKIREKRIKKKREKGIER